MRVCLVASSRFPIAEPFAGGLEAHTAVLAAGLRRRGHAVTLFAAAGSAPSLGVAHLDLPAFEPSAAARADVGAPPEVWMREHHAYLDLMVRLAREGSRHFEVVHNNSLHHLPVAMAAALDLPLVTSLHTPPIAWLESAIALAPDGATFTAVSRRTADSWAHVASPTVVPNGVDTCRWTPGPGGPGAIWTGRLVPEKAPHLAIDAARSAGLPLVLAGPVHDVAYMETHVRPRLGDDVVYAGHLDTDRLVAAVGAARVALVTPEWDEPYGLVAAEAMACGTPVAALARGGLVDVVGTQGGRLAPPGDPEALVRSVREAAVLPRRQVRAHAVRHCSADRMIRRYERIYRDVTTGRRAA
ncbi:glycosyltransferase family 4 protein [Aeromicrobium halocynthiae]|uniref:Glycosyltransferase family 4 protein n=1 Tax=Aeromicrobium halocynthiae TaxID=560557 RepID=A0ABN2W7Z5_9ACTN